MIYIPELNRAFCHIPRTSGISISLAILEAFPGSTFGNDAERIHWPAWRIREEYPGVEIFSMIRNPWEIWRSNYGFDQRYYDERRPFGEWIRAGIEINWPTWSPGFFATFLDDQARLFRYETRPYRSIAEYLGRRLKFRRHNRTIHSRPFWSRDLVDLIGDHCRDDIDRFDYQPPTV